MYTRLRQSSRGIRVATLSMQLVFVASILLGLTTPPDEQSTSDRALTPFIWLVLGGLVLLVIRTLFIGIYLAPGTVLVRSWLRTYRISVNEETRFGLEAWSDWILSKGQPVGNAQMIAITGTSPRSFPATGVRWSRAIAQRDLLNAYCALVGVTEKTARDWARGEEWRLQRDQSKMRLNERQRLGGRHSERFPSR
jgi:hypothetical protein